MSKPIRIKDEVYSRLEKNAKGYESVSDTIKRAVLALEKQEAQTTIPQSFIISLATLARNAARLLEVNA